MSKKKQKKNCEGSAMSQPQNANTTCAPVPSSESSPEHVHKKHSRHKSSTSRKATETRSLLPSTLKKKRLHRHGSTDAPGNGTAQSRDPLPPRSGGLTAMSAKGPPETGGHAPREDISERFAKTLVQKSPGTAVNTLPEEAPQMSSKSLSANSTNSDSRTNPPTRQRTSGISKRFAKTLAERNPESAVDILPEEAPHLSCRSPCADSTNSNATANSPTRQRTSGTCKHFAKALASPNADTEGNILPGETPPTMPTNLTKTSGDMTPDDEMKNQQRRRPSLSWYITMDTTPPDKTQKPNPSRGGRPHATSKCCSSNSTGERTNTEISTTSRLWRIHDVAGVLEKPPEDLTQPANGQWKHTSGANMETSTAPFDNRSSRSLTGVSLTFQLGDERELTKKNSRDFQRHAEAMHRRLEVAGRGADAGGVQRAPSRQCILTDVGSPDDTSLSRPRGYSSPRRSPKSQTPTGSAYSGKLPGSALATVDDTRLSKVSRWKLCTVVATPFVFIGVSILLMHLLPRANRTHLARQKRVSRWVQQLGKACVTADCERAVSEIRSSIDMSVDPCRDFYRFACGRWGRGKHDASYMAAQRLAYVKAVNETLWNTGHFLFSREETRQMSLVYRSCLAFFDREPVNIEEAWSTCGIDARFWMDVSSFSSLFVLFVGNVLEYNMESVINARWRYASTDLPAPPASVEISTGTSIARHLGQSFRKALLVRALEAVGGVAHEYFPQIEAIDDTVHKLTPKISSRFPTKEAHLHDLDTARANWSGVLFEYAKLFDEPPPSKARVQNLDGVQKVLEFLGRANLRTVAVYLTMVPLAKFFVLANNIQLRVVSDQEYDENIFKYESCVRTVELFFTDSYRQWVIAYIEGQRTVDDVTQIFTVTVEAARAFNKKFPRIPLDDKRIAAVPHLIKWLPEDASDASNTSDEASNPPIRFSGDFISNTILFSQQRRRNSGTATCEPIITLSSIAMRWNDTETLLRLLMPDFYHVGATETAVNYGTLAYYVSTVAFQAAVAENWTSSSDYGPCIADYVHSNMGLSLHEPSWDYIVGLHWAVQVALEAAVTRGAEFNRSKHLSRLFFLRFSQTCCSRADLPRDLEDDINEMEQSPESCNAVAMTVPAFAGAFDCTGMPLMEC